jgi:DHA2 family multidrug resistance protein
MIFVPLTTVTLSTIPKEEMGNATGMFNLLRNIGGSVGIALCATQLARLSQSYQSVLVAHVNPYNLASQDRISALSHAAVVKGIDPATSGKTALAVIYGLVQRQAGMLSYNYIFWSIGLVFLAIVPLLLLLKKPKNHRQLEIH